MTSAPIDRERSTDARAQVQSIAAIVTAAVEFQDARTANQYLSALGRDPNIEALAIVLEDGTVFAEYHRPGTQRVDLADASTRQRLIARRTDPHHLSPSTHRALSMPTCGWRRP